jgi:ABC-type sugar transport system permease subunit
MLLALVLDRQDLGCAKRHKLFAVAVVTLSTASSWIALLVWQIRYADAVGLQGWCSPGFVLACVSIALHGANLSLVRCKVHRMRTCG